AIGPCIGGDSYEVGPEFPKPFLDQGPGHARFFRPASREGHFMFDLPGYVAARAREAGIAHVADIALDTCADPDRFFSYRRTTQLGLREYGRLVSMIAL